MWRTMRFVVFGLTVSSSWGNGHATIWRGLCKALARSAHSVTFFEKDVPYYSNHRDLSATSDYDLRIYGEWADIEGCARQSIENSDCAIVTSYCPDARSASDLILDSKTFKIFYDLDTPVTLSELGQERQVYYIPPYGLAPFDLVLSYTGGKALKELSRQLGARRVAPLYGSVDPDTHHRVMETEPRFSADLSYLGTYAADRQSQLEEFFLKPAKSLPDKRFCLAGAMYPVDFPWSSNIFFVRHLPPPEHPAFYSSSALTLNVTRGAMARMGYCPSGRLFEAAACGTPIISDCWEGLDEFFLPNEEILIAKTSDDVVQALNLDESELIALAQASQERTLTSHTAAHRADELVRCIEASA
jgi:spore maturation protein CgeB